MSEKELETRIRNLINNRISNKYPTVYALENKKAVDVLICKDGSKPELFFLEIKYHKKKHGRLGFGSSGGRGFQPEILQRKPKYFERNMRWILSDEDHESSFLFVDNETIRDNVSGEVISQKFNNIQKRIFKNQTWLTEDQLVEDLIAWMKL